MGDPLQLALMFGPLSVYFYILGVWHSGRRPKVVAGRLDHALLAFGLFGVVVVGPAGRAMLGLLFGPPHPLVWIFWSGFVLIWLVFLGSGTNRRTVVYKVDEPTMRRALENAVARVDPRAAPTIRGYENRAELRAIRVHPHSFLKVGVIEVDGTDAEAFAERLRKELRDEFAPMRGPGPNAVTWGLFIFSWIAMLAPLASLVLNEPEVRMMIRAFFAKP